VLLSYSKLVAFQQLLDSDVPEDAYLSKELERYFPQPLQKPSTPRHGAAPPEARDHRHRGHQFHHQPDGRHLPAAHAGRHRPQPGEVAKAFTITRETLDARDAVGADRRARRQGAESVQIDALQVIWEMQRSFTRWLLSRPGAIPDITRRSSATTTVPRHPRGRGHPAGVAAPGLRGQPQGLARWRRADGACRPAGGAALPGSQRPNIIELARERKLRAVEVAKVYFRLGDALREPWLQARSTH
jgi:glutamate dehydrogenase